MTGIAPSPLPSRALSVRLPWDFAILEMGKDIENRSRSHSYRGPVLIHASSWWGPSDIEDDFRFCIDTACAQGTRLSRSLSSTEMKERRGKIVGMVDVVDCVTTSLSPWFFGPVGFTLRNPVAFKNPVVCKGALGFFPIPEEIRAAIVQAEGMIHA